MICRSSKFAMIGGVCSGYAISQKLPVALVRTFAAILFLYTAGGAALLYIAAWIMMPLFVDAASEHLSAEDKLTRSKTNKVIGGVCGAFADYFKIDATFLRAIMLVSVLVAGTGFVIYFFAWMVIPEKA